jgi:hypothetical protein
MKKQTTKTYYEAAHYEHRKNVHGLLMIIIFITALIMAFSSCTTSRRMKDPCKERRGMSGYGYGWIKCRETKKVFILAPDGAIVCTYYDSK